MKTGKHTYRVFEQMDKVSLSFEGSIMLAQLEQLKRQADAQEQIAAALEKLSDTVVGVAGFGAAVQISNAR